MVQNRSPRRNQRRRPLNRPVVIANIENPDSFVQVHPEQQEPDDERPDYLVSKYPIDKKKPALKFDSMKLSAQVKISL